MSFDVIEALRAWLSAATGLGVYAAPPEERPDSFITIERVGGGAERGRDLPSLAIQTWAPTEAEAYELALEVRDLIMWNAAMEVASIAGSEVGSIYLLPDPESRTSRYQVDVDLVTGL